MTQVSSAEFRHPDSERLLGFCRARYEEHDLTLREPEHGTLVADMGFAQVTIEAAHEACRIRIACDDAALLPEFRTGIASLLASFDPALPPLGWSGAAATGALPPTFAAGRVVDCRPLGRSWWRMSVGLAPDGFARFSSETHWHVRLLRPARPDRRPVWPWLTERGTIAWPEGRDRLIDRVFTLRACDAATGTVVFDIFRHPGAPTSDWAATNPVGRTVGLMGPGAKAGPYIDGRERLLAGGDETAVPAILRGLEGLPVGTGGDVVLLVGDAADRQAVPANGPAIIWLLRSEGATDETLMDALRHRYVPGSVDTRFWFAGTKSSAREIRAHFLKAAAFPKDRVHAVGYWS